MSLCFVSLMKLNPLGFQHIFFSVHNFDAVVDFQRSESFQSCWARRSMWPSSQEEVATESGPKRDGAGDTEPSRCSVTAGNLLFNTFNASTQRWCSLLLLLCESSQMWREDSIQDLYSVKYFIQHLNGCNEHFCSHANREKPIRSVSVWRFPVMRETWQDKVCVCHRERKMIIQCVLSAPVTMVMAKGATFSGHTHILFTPHDEKHLCDLTTTGPLQSISNRVESGGDR